MLPRDFPPTSTVQGYFYEWRNGGLLQRINHALVMNLREAQGREASPTACVIDSQSVKTTESGGVSGFDAGKKVKGHKRHIITDTLGLLIGFIIHSAAVQDRDGAVDANPQATFRTHQCPSLAPWPWLAGALRALTESALSRSLMQPIHSRPLLHRRMHTSAAPFSSVQRMRPQVALAKRVCAKPMRRSAHIST